MFILKKRYSDHPAKERVSDANQCLKKKRSSGAALIEIIITLPVLLMMIWLFLYVGIIYNARSSLISAMENSLRVALTKSNLSLSMPDDQSFYLHLDSLCSSLAGAGRVALKPLLFSNLSEEFGIDEYNRNASHWKSWYQSDDGALFCEQPLHNIYATVFIQLMMQNAVGNSIKFPCDPRSNDKKAGAGCLRCIPLNPCSLDRTPLKNSCDQTTIFHRIAIECEFRPDSVFVAPFDALSNLVTGSSTKTVSIVSHRAFFETPSDINWNQ